MMNTTPLETRKAVRSIQRQVAEAYEVPLCNVYIEVTCEEGGILRLHCTIHPNRVHNENENNFD